MFVSCVCSLDIKDLETGSRFGCEILCLKIPGMMSLVRTTETLMFIRSGSSYTSTFVPESLSSAFTPLFGPP